MPILSSSLACLRFGSRWTTKGEPYIEVLRGNKNLTSALSGITAAVVGVILNLALVFGTVVIWPQGLSGGTNWFSAALSVLAFIALYRFKLDVLGLCSPAA